MSDIIPRFAWSYSALSMFRTCPKQYHHVRVLKEYPFVQSKEALYGDRMHKAIELYGKLGVSLPMEFAFVKRTVDMMKALPGKRFWEFKFAMTQDYQLCGYFAKEAWLRAAIDFLCINERTGLARIIDWKSGKSKNADVAQLELMSLAVFKLYPEVKKVKAGLAFLTEDRFMPALFTADRADHYWKHWLEGLEQMDAAYVSGVWNPKPSGLCNGWCPVTTCEHWKPKRN